MARRSTSPPPPPASGSAVAAAADALADALVDEARAALAVCPTWVWAVLALVLIYMRFLRHSSIPRVRLPLGRAELDDVWPAPGSAPLMPPPPSPSSIPCHDPATGAFLGTAPVFSRADVQAAAERARAAQRVWAGSSFRERSLLMRILGRCVLEHAEPICRVSARDTGKTMVDSGLGEVLTSLEKLAWLASSGAACLRPERRQAGRVAAYKRAWVEYHPRGLIGAIVPWNYPFHNVLNPVSAALFSGNAILLKVSEHASWSAGFYLALIRACLAAAGAPEDLVQVVTGYAETGEAVVDLTDQVIFVGSAAVGKRVMARAAQTLTPVTLELGGKDPMVLLPRADVAAALQTALRAGFGAAGQNCLGCERYLVHTSLLAQFVPKVTAAAKAMRQGPPLNGDGNTGVDIGAMCMPGEVERLEAVLSQAEAAGARILAGGHRPAGLRGQFFAPTVVLIPDIAAQSSIRLLREEVFGPVITIIPFDTDDQLVAIANQCDFALGANVFGPPPHVRAVGKRIASGMLSHNDFATTYMCQSLPMGGLKHSGFGKFAGVEGLRDLCVTKAVAEDWPAWLLGVNTFVRTAIPSPLCYPLSDAAFTFVRGTLRLFHGFTWGDKLAGVADLLSALAAPKRKAGGKSL